MKKTFYPSLAIDGIKKNRKLYFPYMLMCITMVMMFYVLSFLGGEKVMELLGGRDTVSMVLSFGKFVMAVFSAIFLFYTNSFLMRRRKKEFGLFNILGMGKNNICRIMVWESFFTAVSTIVIGLVVGILVSKFAELALLNMVGRPIDFTFRISGMAVLYTVIAYIAIHFLIFLNSVVQVKLTNTIGMLRSENFGEKPPKANWLLGLMGIVILAAAYYLAVRVADSISAMVWFFVAVIMVIIATYLLFIAGSVVLCKVLQKNKKYYYKANHFVSVSSMAYRMKRNGGGLASVCILATMVLVIVSSTTCLYFGLEDSLNRSYSREMCNRVGAATFKDFDENKYEEIKKNFDEITEKEGGKIKNPVSYRYISMTGYMKEGEFIYDLQKVSANEKNAFSSLADAEFISLKEYNQLTGSDEELKEGEVLIATHNFDYKWDYFNIDGCEKFKVKGQVDNMPVCHIEQVSAAGTIYVIMPDVKESVKEFINTVTTKYNMMTKEEYSGLLSYVWNYEFDTGLAPEKQIKLGEKFEDVLYGHVTDEEDWIGSFSIDNREVNRTDFVDTFGSLMFLGVILSIIFIIAAVLIIYYKQISEGYEDQSKFEIMQKVGMTKEDIRKSINSQILTVFFAPLIAAGIHLAFAFPMIRQILKAFTFNNTWLFGVTTIVSFLVFGVLYGVIYKVTSNAYYDIVVEK